MDKLIVEAALNETSTKEQNPNVPYSVQECAVDAMRCAEAGATIVHFHARDDVTGEMIVPGTAQYASTMRSVREMYPGLLMYPTYSSLNTTPEERFGHVLALAADPTVEMRAATIDPGSTNFSWFDPTSGTIDGDLPFHVSHAEARYFFEICDTYDILYSVVVREPGHVRTAVAYHRAGWIRGTVLFKLNLADHMLWGLPPSAESVDIYMGLVPDDIPFTWMAYTYGPSHWELCRLAIERGAHVRVGLGDNPVERDGGTLTNAELVERVVGMARSYGREIATPEEARSILGRGD